jgi:hypothetical protein
MPLRSRVIASGEERAAAALPSVERLLLEGGDARIATGADGKTNRYGCGPFPDPALLAFGSSTASIVSEAGFAAAGRLRERLGNALDSASAPAVYATELGRIRHELIRLCGVNDMPGLDVVFAASGTDLHLIAAQLAACTGPGPARVIMMAEEETGRGVPLAMAGRHFGDRTALGRGVREGALLDGGSAIETVSVPLRLPNGMPRPAAEIDADAEAQVACAVADGRRVLLTLIDVSKTGMLAPSPACALALRRAWPAQVDVLVDACQFRIAHSTLRAYLEHDFMVALTGSKFLTGPTFSGVLCVPNRVALQLRKRPLPRSLSAYSSTADWPAGWDVANLEAVPNFGLLLRWEAALEELKAFRAIPDCEVADFLRKFALAIQNRLKNDPHFAPLPVPAIDRSPITAADSWDRIPTIFPFLLYRHCARNERHPLNREQTVQVYRLLQTDLADADVRASAPSLPDQRFPALRCQLGQAVPCGEQEGMPTSALRICTSARLVVEAIAAKQGDAVIQRALTVLDKAAGLADTLPV